MTFSGTSWGLITYMGAFGAEICLLTAPRIDNGLFNQSPRTPIAPLVDLQPGSGGYSFTIPTADPEGDIVHCRWSITATECQSTCYASYTGGLPFSLTSGCNLTYTGGDVPSCNYYPICIQLEDYYVAYPTLKLSSAPVQFLVGICPQTTPPISVTPLVVDNCSSNLAYESIVTSTTPPASAGCLNNLQLANSIVPSSYPNAVNSTFPMACEAGYASSSSGTQVMVTCTQFNATYSDWTMSSNCLQRMYEKINAYILFSKTSNYSYEYAFFIN